VLLLVDGNFGFEMETFEFLNILQARRPRTSPAAPLCAPPGADSGRKTPQVHGFPKVMGVLTHLDEFTDASKLKKVKKTLKVR
jgi:ribosome biogenesis protein BMS1